MGTFLDWVARNRAKIGGMMFVGWMALQTDTNYIEWIKLHRSAFTLNGVAVAMVGYIWGAGSHDSDTRQREKQKMIKAFEGE